MTLSIRPTLSLQQPQPSVLSVAVAKTLGKLVFFFPWQELFWRSHLGKRHWNWLSTDLPGNIYPSVKQKILPLGTDIMMCLLTPEDHRYLLLMASLPGVGQSPLQLCWGVLEHMLCHRHVIHTHFDSSTITLFTSPAKKVSIDKWQVLALWFTYSFFFLITCVHVYLCMGIYT